MPSQTVAGIPGLSMRGSGARRQDKESNMTAGIIIIHVEQPQLVIDAIREVVEAVRAES